jgi:hypothetical protein
MHPIRIACLYALAAGGLAYGQATITSIVDPYTSVLMTLPPGNFGGMALQPYRPYLSHHGADTSLHISHDGADTPLHISHDGADTPLHISHDGADTPLHINFSARGLGFIQMNHQTAIFTTFQ